ncbi:uncharacterized protein FOMMEDRAFT_160945 [Fomitiporia mediterranea MF3/22]|uniref:uncharacterized protein n=1 Tax=Fomitiporia mediterranea (strain MF3/22) TaxID=694068 RepID=UPI0004407A8B|nr:uncharacterized protein FOMMEDRAFT_160945 [Fomitiporia mediterranea MF3/22]EJC99336.1 hypothetical protein FOMMEDRAFT_160945 [Fomitiporia mediterranea MF3/22]
MAPHGFAIAIPHVSGHEEQLNNIYPDTDWDCESEPSNTSTATASNLPGPGCNLGNIYSYFGKPLENAINRLAERSGYGARAIEQRTASKSESNRHLASCAILLIATASPYLCKLLWTHNATGVLERVWQREQEDVLCALLPLSRKALIHLVECEIRTKGKEMISLGSKIRRMEDQISNEELQPDLTLDKFQAYYIIYCNLLEHRYHAMVYIVKRGKACRWYSDSPQAWGPANDENNNRAIDRMYMALILALSHEISMPGQTQPVDWVILGKMMVYLKYDFNCYYHDRRMK